MSRTTGGVTYSIVIPVYCSGTWLGELVGRIDAAMRPLAEPFEVILVNDASPDAETWPAIEELSRRHPWVKGIDLLYNAGQFKAILCGLEQAAGTYIITMDDDLQHPPEELPKLVAAMKANPEMDCVMGRYEVKSHGMLRNLGSRVLAWAMTHLYGKPRGVTTTSFRIMKRELAGLLVLYRAARPQLGPLVVRLTRRVMNTPVEHHARHRGRSGYRPTVMMGEFFQSLINASIAPLRLVTTIGFLSAFVAFGLGVWYLVRKLVGGIGVPGYTSIVLAVVFSSGMILVGIGMLGEYIGRIIHELTGLPRYAIRRRTGSEDEPVSADR